MFEKYDVMKPDLWSVSTQAFNCGMQSYGDSTRVA